MASKGKDWMGGREIHEMEIGKALGQDQPRDIVHTECIHTCMHTIPE